MAPPKTTTAPKVIRNPEDLKIRLWSYFRVTVQITNQLRGGTPKNPKIIDAWLNAAVKDESRVHMLIADAKADLGLADLSAEQTEALVSTLGDSSWNGFRVDSELGLFLRGYKIKAMLKESANILRDRIHITALKQRLAERVFVMEERVFLGAMQPDGTDENPIHVITRQGPRTSLKRVDFLVRPRLTYHLQVYDEHLTRNTDKAQIWPTAYLSTVLQLAQEQGQGAERSLGYGRFTVEEFEQLEGRPDIPDAHRNFGPNGTPTVEETAENLDALKRDTVDMDTLLEDVE